MFDDRRARFRSYQIIETIATEARRLGRVSNHSQFDIVGYITGTLQLSVFPDLQIIIFEKGDFEVLAFVDTAADRKSKILYVERRVWLDAQSGLDEAIYILAHEIGHIFMHSHSELAYSGNNASVIGDLQPEERVEPQAHLFADLFLVPEIMLDGFSSSDDIADYFNVTTECAARRFDHIADKRRRQNKIGYTGEACHQCANFTLVRNGTYLKCDICGSTTDYS